MKVRQTRGTLTVGGRLVIAALAGALLLIALILLSAFAALGRDGVLDTAKLQGLVALPLLLGVPAIISYAVGEDDDAGNRVLLGITGAVGLAAGLVWALDRAVQAPGTCSADPVGLLAIALVALSAVVVGASAIAATLVARHVGATRAGVVGLLVRLVVGGSILIIGLVVALGLQAVMHPAVSCQPV